MKLTVNFPTLPYAQLSVNYKRSHHWTKYSRYARAARLEAARELQAAYPSLDLTPPVKLRWRAIYGLPKGRRAQDSDNLGGWVKHYIDGIADVISAGDDSGFTYVRSSITRDGVERPGWFAIILEIDD